ncbi:hypothetical protein SJA_C1-16440 [Sphingobium indicum UT26S]|uniref:Uncharacterized protein n=1 Tax=Sphingobium indicum (strain DSM 16413 / CCM 7287 / MTCC 6362 / UT26 / NBRC 101211 / UT26S) TaxID=452662 RepID=D4Z1J6_SPHIU|nr:hypothetical protein SJA_C1-16440 [Sphingobium indicum UT26S]
MIRGPAALGWARCRGKSGTPDQVRGDGGAMSGTSHFPTSAFVHAVWDTPGLIKCTLFLSPSKGSVYSTQMVPILPDARRANSRQSMILSISVLHAASDLG